MTFSKFRQETVGDNILTHKEVNKMGIRLLLSVCSLSLLARVVCFNYLGITFPLGEFIFFGLVALYINLFDMIVGDEKAIQKVNKISKFGYLVSGLAVVLSIIVFVIS